MTTAITIAIYLFLVALLAVQVVFLARASRSRSRALEALRAEKEFTENLIQSAREMIISCDVRRRITVFNKAAERAFGYTREEALGKSVNLLYASEKESLRVHRAMTERGVFTGEILNQRKDRRTFPAFLCASTLRDKAGKPIGVMGISLDISDQKRVQEERERLSKLKDEFIAIASHDLKSPLGSIAGYAQLLAKMAPAGEVMTEETYGFVERIRALSWVMQRIVEDFLDFYALQDGRLVLSTGPVDLNAVAAEVVDHYAEQAQEKGIQLALEPASGLPAVTADRDRLEQVIGNFVSNAVKFCYNGCVARVRSKADGETVTLEVGDNGPGLRDEDMLKVFVKYARLSNKPTGGEKSSGLGLAICKELIELHGGEIGVHNNGEGGATFWFRLPIAKSHWDASGPIA